MYAYRRKSTESKKHSFERGSGVCQPLPGSAIKRHPYSKQRLTPNPPHPYPLTQTAYMEGEPEHDGVTLFVAKGGETILQVIMRPKLCLHEDSLSFVAFVHRMFRYRLPNRLTLLDVVRHFEMKFSGIVDVTRHVDPQSRGSPDFFFSVGRRSRGSHSWLTPPTGLSFTFS